MEIHENLTLGIDLGIASCGWAIIRRDEHGGQIVDWGARTFDVPETDKDRTPTNQLRRAARGMRRVIRRRRQRMNEIRRLFKLHGLLGSDTKSALWIRDGSLIDPWTCRAQGLDRKLTGPELAVALGHVAKHRGFKSNSKRKSNEPASDDSKMLKEIEQTRDRLKSYRTVGEMFAKDSEFAARKRNRDGDYSRSVLRDDQEKEVRLLFDAQRRAGNTAAIRELEEAFISVAFFQRPLADSEDKVGPCPFEGNERRAAKRSPSFEKFRFLSRLTSLRMETASGEHALSPEQIAEAVADFGNQPGMTFKRLRKTLDLDDGIRFAGISTEDEKDRDVVNRSKGNGCMQGTRSLRKSLGEAAWQSLAKTPDLLDRISFVLTFREDRQSIRAGLEALGLAEVVLGALIEGLENGSFSDFKGAGHLSAKACRKIIPFLMKGMVYSDACKAAGYNHAKRPETKLDEINNPVARKSLTEALKQVNAIVQVYGLPGRIHVELARDVGKSKDERDEITRGIDKRNKALDRLADQFREETGRERRRGSDELLRFQLWKEQHGRCAYCDGDIHVNDIASGDNAIQLDHILPWSRSGDDSPVNKTLCHAKCNQEKRGQTPYEWFGKDESRWQRFTACIDSNKEFKGRKKRNYLLKDAAVLEEKFRPRNLNDTRYATRLLLDMLARMYPDDVRALSNDQKEAARATEHWFETEKRERATVRVASRPGPLTDRLRRGWGIQDLKKELQPDGEKRKSDDRHHALDALIVAATSQASLQRLTKAFQEEEQIGGHRDFSNLDPPWAGFVEEVREKFARIFVSRAERHRARGKAHDATIRRLSAKLGDAAHNANAVSQVYSRYQAGELTRRERDEQLHALYSAGRMEAEKAASESEPAIFERRAIESLINDKKIKEWDKSGELAQRVNETLLCLIPDVGRNRPIVESITDWITSGRPADRPPLSPSGDVIRKVRVRCDARPGVIVVRGFETDHPGVADRSAIVRVDIFQNRSGKSRARYSFVPVYAHQAAQSCAPCRVFTRGFDYEHWPILSADSEFLFSLYSMSLIDAIYKTKESQTPNIARGYFRGLDVSDGRITIFDHFTAESKAKDSQRRIAPTTLIDLKKKHVDRLGRVFDIASEKRTWHGVVCT